MPRRAADVLHVEGNERGVRLTREAFTATDRETTLHVIDDGDDTVDFLRRQGQYDSTPRPELVTRYRTHANAYVSKPPTLEEFVSLVTALEAFWLEHAQFPPNSA